MSSNSQINICHWCSAALWLLFALVPSSRTASVEPSKMASLLADTVTHFLGHGMQELKSDNVAEESSFPQTRGGGGYGHGHGGGGHGHGAITLDPVSIISLLALGAFLINNILQLLRANMNNNNGGGAAPAPAPGGFRSMPSMTLENIVFPSPAINGLNYSSTEPSFINFFENVGSLYYLQPKKRHLCMKRVVCDYNAVKESRESNPNTLKTKIFDFMLSTVTKIVAPEMDQSDKEERCLKAQKLCSDSLLKDARVSIEYKIYSQVSSWLTKLAFNGLASG